VSDRQDFDLIVVGAGSGGVRLARMSAAKGARVAVALGVTWRLTPARRGLPPKSRGWLGPGSRAG